MMSDFEISPLTLGTVSLGLNYGVFEGQHQPDQQTAMHLIDTALKNGINCFDTAREYGTAETLLGELLSGKAAKRAVIVTKFKISKEAVGNFSLAKEQARSSVLASLQQLKLARLPVCLFHMVSG
ncbi:MAG: aldo/keto reductase, partial [Niabella sp.]|nr:aldo/keto reductase [Niabella sp.]